MTSSPRARRIGAGAVASLGACLVVALATLVSLVATGAPASAQESGPTTTVRMQIEQTPITRSGSETNTSGLVIFVIVVGAIVIGAIVLILRYRGRGTNSRPPAAP